MDFSVLRLFCLVMGVFCCVSYSPAQTAQDSAVSQREKWSSAAANTTSMEVLDDKRPLQIGDRRLEPRVIVHLTLSLRQPLPRRVIPSGPNIYNPGA